MMGALQSRRSYERRSRSPPRRASGARARPEPTSGARALRVSYPRSPFADLANIAMRRATATSASLQTRRSRRVVEERATEADLSATRARGTAESREARKDSAATRTALLPYHTS